MEEVKENALVIPGDYLGPLSSFSKGQGTYARSNNLYASLTGKVSFKKDPTEGKPSVSVAHPLRSGKKNVPTVGSSAICQVVSINERQAKVSILTINDLVLPEPFHGVIRREDIRAVEKDSVEVFQSFRPRDIVRARFIAPGDGQHYVMSTAENELGVVWAQCDCGETMAPVSWCEMQCKKGDKEKRKVAKVIDAIPVII